MDVSICLSISIETKKVASVAMPQHYSAAPPQQCPLALLFLFFLEKEHFDHFVQLALNVIQVSNYGFRLSLF